MKEARATLEHLYSVTRIVSPQHPAPPGWIMSLHAALDPPDLDGRLDHLRLDDAFAVNMASLHRRIGQVLHALDELTVGGLGTAPREVR